MTTPVRIVGIDPGLRNTGWGVISSEANRLIYLGSGTVSSNKKFSLAERLKQLFCGLSSVLEEWQPDEASVETTFVNRDAGATLKLGQARGMALVVPALAGVAVYEYAPNLVKKTVVGAGHADKAQIRAMVQHLLPRAEPDTEDATDALALAITHAHHRERAELVAGLAAREVAAP